MDTPRNSNIIPERAFERVQTLVRAGMPMSEACSSVGIGLAEYIYWLQSLNKDGIGEIAKLLASKAIALRMMAIDGLIAAVQDGGISPKLLLDIARSDQASLGFVQVPEVSRGGDGKKNGGKPAYIDGIRLRPIESVSKPDVPADRLSILDDD